MGSGGDERWGETRNSCVTSFNFRLRQTGSYNENNKIMTLGDVKMLMVTLIATCNDHSNYNKNVDNKYNDNNYYYYDYDDDDYYYREMGANYRREKTQNDWTCSSDIDRYNKSISRLKKNKSYPAVYKQFTSFYLQIWILKIIILGVVTSL